MGAEVPTDGGRGIASQPSPSPPLDERMHEFRMTAPATLRPSPSSGGGLAHSKACIVLVVAMVLLAGLAVWALVAWDPLRQLYTVTDHGVSIHGEMDSATFNLIMRGPQPGNMTHYTMVGSGGTASFRSEGFKLPAYSPPLLILPRLGWFSGPAPDWGRVLRVSLDWFFSLFLQDARAVCGAGGGACFWVSGSGNWSGASHWSATSGGATCGVSCVPTTTDTMTFDASGGTTPTVTLNVNPSVTGSLTVSGNTWTFSGATATLSVGAVSITGGSLTDALSSWTMTSIAVSGAATWSAGTTAYNDSGGFSTAGTSVVTMGAGKTLNVGSTWNTSVGTFTPSTSTVVITAVATMSTPNGFRTNYFYNLTINVSVLVTLAGNIGVANVLTVNGTLTGASNFVYLINAATAPNATPLVVGGSGSISGVGIVDYVTDSAVNVAATTYRELYIETIASGATVNWTATALGNITATSDVVIYNSATLIATLAMGANTLTINSTTALGSGITYPLHVGFSGTLGALTFTSGALSVTAPVANTGVQVPTTASYVQWGSSTSHVIRGKYTNDSTSASWSAGTGTVTFLYGASNPVQTSGASLSGSEFNNVIFDTSIAAGITYTLGVDARTGGLVAAGSVTIQNTASLASGATVLDTNSVGNYALTVSGGLTLNALGALLAEASIVSITGAVSIASASAYMSLGASVFSAASWSNVSTSSSWSMGTSVVTLQPAAGFTYTPTTTLPVTEFFGLTFSTTAATQQTIMLGGALTIGGTFTVKGTNTLFDLGNPTAFALSEHGLTLSTGGVLQLRTSTVTTAGSWDDTGGTLQRFQTDTEVFSGTGNIKAGAAPTSHFYNMTVNSGVTSTLVGGFMIANILTVNGIILGNSPNNAQQQFGTFCTSSTNPCVVMGAGGDLSQSGYFVYAFNNGGDQYVTATTYQHLAIEGQSTTTAHLLGNIATPSCGIYNACAIILLQVTAGNSFVVRSENFNITAGGAFWVGDGGTVGATFYAGSSTITAFSISPNGAGIAHWQTATMVVHPSSLYDPISYYQVDTAVSYGENSTWTIHGSWKLWESSSTYFVAGSASITILADEGTPSIYGDPGSVYLKGTGFIEFDNSVWNLNGDTWQTTQPAANICTSSSTVTLSRAGGINMSLNGNCLPNLTITGGAVLTTTDSPFDINGNVNIASASSALVMGVGVWNVTGNWTNISTSASWNAGTSTVNLTGSGTITAATLPSLSEFATINFPGGASYILSNSLTVTTLNVTVTAALQVPGTGSSTRATLVGFKLSSTSGYITLSAVDSFVIQANQINVTFTMADSVSTDAVSVTLSTMSLFARVYLDGAVVAVMQPNQTVTVNGPWSTHVVSIRNTTAPDQNPAFVQISCSSSYALLGAQLSCSVPGGIFGDPSSYVWYVNGQAVASGGSFSSYIFSPGFGDTVMVTLTYWSQQIAMVRVGLSTAPNLAVYLSIVVSAALVATVVSRERQVWKRYRRTPSMEELELMRQDREARMRGRGSR